jgi:predicted transcriptional regulator of viral defense system
MRPEARAIQLARTRRLFRLSDAVAAGVHPESVRRLVRHGKLARVGRGLYALTAVEATEHHTLAEVAKLMPKAIFSLLTALRFHGLGTQHPREVWLSLHRAASIPRVDFARIRIVRISGAALTTGIDEHTIDGVPVRITNLERTVVDCFRFRDTIGVDVAVAALSDYHRLSKGSADDLWREADRLRMTRVMQPYWDAIAGFNAAARWRPDHPAPGT